VASVLGRLRAASLGARLIAFSTLLTAVAVCLAFFLLSFSLRRHTKELLAQTLAHHQRTILHLQERGLAELLRTSSLMTDSPTLRAAIETYTSEASPRAPARADLLATIEEELDKVAAGLERDLLVVTDRSGRVLATSGRGGRRPAAGRDLGADPAVRHALDADGPVGPQNLAVWQLGDDWLRVGSVPIVLQGFVIGTLTVGDRIDDAFVGELRRSFDCDFVVLAGDQVVGSTLDTSLEAGDRQALASDAPSVARLGATEFVRTSVVLGTDPAGRPFELHLLHSLDRALGDSNRLLGIALLSWGCAAVLLAGIAGWWMSRSVLRPLEAFVGFMRSVASSGDHSRRFDAKSSCAEVETLNLAYDHLMRSLAEHERRLLLAARADLDRLERLKESEKLAALGRLLSGAAHEINNPLTGVVGNLELLLRDEHLAPPTRERVERIRREGQRISALVRNLLKISHRDTGERAVLDVQAVLRDTIEVRRHDFAAAGMELVLDLAPDELAVAGNELELHQLFLNLVNNAYDALAESAGAAPGGAAPRLVVRTAVEARTVLVDFEDTGPGMENPKLVFDHFYTTKQVGKGTGLGLSIAYAVVEKHGGAIRAENRAEGGARFRITLPLTDPCTEPARPPAAPAAVELPGATAPLAASVLVVDDEPTIVDLQKEILESLGAEVVAVSSGTAAIGALERRPFDLIVTDLKMPGVSGQDLFRWVASNRPSAIPGFVFVTGEMDGGAELDLVHRTGARYLLKPFSIEQYVEAMRETLDALHVPR
jgi:signal transduction histidine kinase/ActR/RegA family two-component response regulator